MTDKNKEGELVPVPKTHDVPQPAEMDLDTARGVLATVVTTDEKTFRSIPDRIGHYGTDKIREAVDVVSRDIFKRHPEQFPPGGHGLTLRKTGTWGRLVLSAHLLRENSVWRDDLRPEELENEELGNIMLGFSQSEKGDYSLMFNFGLRDAPRQAKFGDTFFVVGTGDNQKDVHSHAFGIIPKELSLRDFRFLVKGMRWMSANLLQWDEPGVVTPNDLPRQEPTNIQTTPPKALP